MSLNCFSGYELDGHYTDCFKSNIECGIIQSTLQCPIFIHSHVPTWIQGSDSGLVNNLLSLKNMFWLVSLDLDMLALKHPPVHLCACWTNSCQSCHRRSRLWPRFIHKGASFNYSQIRSRGYPRGAAVCSDSGQSDLNHASHHKPLSDPHGSPFTWTGFSIFGTYTKEISAHLLSELV